MKRKIRIFTLMLALCMFVGTIPAYAVNPYGSVTIQLTSDDDIDLSGIEISVYQATPATVTEVYTLYNETFDSTVTTNANGTVTFAKPSQYFSITVELDSLPAGYGITKQTKFFNPDVTSEIIDIALVANAEVTLTGSEISPKFFSADGIPLNTAYEDVKADNNYADMPWESIDALTSFSVSGTLVNGSMEIPYSVPVDISEVNVVEKYTALYNYGAISEKEMILRQCEVLMEPGHAYMRSAETMDAITKYRDKLAAQSVPVDSGEIVAYAAPTTNAELALVEDVLTYSPTSLTADRSTNEIARGDHAIVYSDLPQVGDLMTAEDIKNFADEIVSEIDKIYRYFITIIGFRSPQGTGGSVEIEIVDSDYVVEVGKTMSGVYGLTVGNYIRINYDLKDDEVTDRWKTTLAHEYQHAIQNSYVTGVKNSWLSESCANFASAMYAHNVLGDYQDRSVEYYLSILQYLLDHEQSLPSFTYSMLFPMYLYSYTGASGWNTIKKLYEYCYANTSTSTATTFSSINQALQSLDSSYNIQDILGSFAVDNLFLNITYPVFYHSDWGRIYNDTIHHVALSDVQPGITLDPLGTSYHEIFGFSDDSGVSITFTLTSGDYANMSILGVVHNGTEPMESLHINAPNPERFTLTLSDNTIEYFLGNSDGYNVYTLVAVNTGYTSQITYDIAVN